MIRLAVARLARSNQCQLVLAMLGILLWSEMTRAADLFVTIAADSGAGSLREALTQAASGDRIVFDIATPSTIVLVGPLPEISGNISFANMNAGVTIDRNGVDALSFTGGLVDPTALVVINAGVPTVPDSDIVASAPTTIFGDGAVTGNMVVPGVISPGADAGAGTIGTLDVTGDLDLSNAQVRLDISTDGGTPSNDLIIVSGTATVMDATLVPIFVGDQFSVGQTFRVLGATDPIADTFANQGDTFALPDHPFLQAVTYVTNSTPGTAAFGFEIADNGKPFASLVSGCNQMSAAGLLDQLPTVGDLRSGSSEQVLLGINQLSGSIYPSLIGAEIAHVQYNLDSVRDIMVRDANSRTGRLTRWARAYGLFRDVDRDDCETIGYGHNVGGVELGCGLVSNAGLTAHAFAHLAGGYLALRDVDQRADIGSYRMGGSIAYVAGDVYLLAAGGAGIQKYDVRRSLTALDGSSFSKSSFDGSAQFGYFELAYTTPWTPYVALHATGVDLDPITETGNPDFSLINDGGDAGSLRGVLGVSLASLRPVPLGKAATRLRFGWMHAYLNEAETIVSQIAGDGTPTGSLVDRGVESGRDWAFVRMQREVKTSLGVRFMVAYHTYFNGESSFNSFLGGASFEY
jgi:uncharacterized protein with beta-barrel porin domain